MVFQLHLQSKLLSRESHPDLRAADVVLVAVEAFKKFQCKGVVEIMTREVHK